MNRQKNRNVGRTKSVPYRACSCLMYPGSILERSKRPANDTILPPRRQHDAAIPKATTIIDVGVQAHSLAHGTAEQPRDRDAQRSTVHVPERLFDTAER